MAGERWIHDDFPTTARNALLHLLSDLVERNFVRGWITLDKELRRIARADIRNYSESKVSEINAARLSAKLTIEQINWTSVLDFCERLHSHLAEDVRVWDDLNERWRTSIEREKVQLHIANELERIFLEEHLGFTFFEDEIRLRGRQHTLNQIGKVEPTFSDGRLNEARQHFSKALRYFGNPQTPDYENTVKEAVCAVEAAAKRLFPDVKSKTLADVVKGLCNGKERRLPKQIGDTFSGLYAYRNGGDGILHGATDGESATQALAEYVLALSASQIILLHEIESQSASEVPF